MVYYIVAIPICFCAYREFKGMLFDESGGAAMMGLPSMNRARSTYQGGVTQIGSNYTDGTQLSGIKSTKKE